MLSRSKIKYLLALFPIRFVVVPVNHDIFYIGGRTGGLIKSTDGGTAWSPMTWGTMQFGGLNSFLNGDVNVYGRCYMSAVGGLGVIVCDLKEK